MKSGRRRFASGSGGETRSVAQRVRPRPTADARDPADGDADDDDVAIAVNPHNPKRAGSQSHARYERYKGATTRAEYLALGGSAADFKFDVERGFVAVRERAACT